MAKNLLTPQQKSFLNFFNSQPELHNSFYFSGGTALSHYYLRHRYSEDLDFFSDKEFQSSGLNLFLNSNKHLFGARHIQFTQSFNRNIFFLSYAKTKKELKAEFTYYPFERIDKTKKDGNISVDSVLDIAVNKAFTLTQQARGRDYYDIYSVFKKYKFDFKDLLKKARQKFDYPINNIELGKNLVKVTSFLDDPVLSKNMNKEDIEKYFLGLAKNLDILG